jgi:homoaconitase/3-isopropylmalate dehydratase large subunit
MSGITMTENILAAHAGTERVRPGDLVVVSVDIAVLEERGLLVGGSRNA